MKTPTHDVICPNCGNAASIASKRSNDSKRYECRQCRHRFTVEHIKPPILNPVPPREPKPFVELHRDPFSHMNLAMLVRK